MPRKPRAPRTRVELAAWIKGLISAGRIREFYLSTEWRKLERHVKYTLDNNECQICKRRGKYSKANSVHHVNEVKVRPDLALSVWYFDADGNCKRNLLSVCESCHNEIHDKHRHGIMERYSNEERW